jgi:hypothetical protein
MDLLINIKFMNSFTEKSVVMPVTKNKSI